MKLIENSTITLYKIPFVDENLFDFHDNSVNCEEFSTNFHSALYTFATIPNILLFPLSDVRSIKITDASLQIVLPIKKSRLEGFTLIECKTNELHPGFTEYVYFNINSITSLNDNDTNPSCQLFCSINYYYSYLFDIQLSLSNTQVNFEMRHVRRYDKTSASTNFFIKKGVEGCTGVKFSQYIPKVNYWASSIGSNLLWLYITLDEDALFATASHEDVTKFLLGKVSQVYYNAFCDTQRVIAMPLGFYSESGFEPCTAVRWIYTLNGTSYDETREGDNYARYLGIVSGNNIIDAYISNQAPPFDFVTSVENGVKKVTIHAIPTVAVHKVTDKLVYTTTVSCAMCFSSLMIYTREDGGETFPQSIETPFIKRKQHYNFANKNSTLDNLQNFEGSVFNDPAFDLYPFTKLSTICGEFQYFPSRFTESFTINIYSYLRSVNFYCKSVIVSDDPELVPDKQLFYLNAFISPSSFARYSKDVMNTFYRNNSGQYRVKMTTERAKAAVNIISGITKMGIAGAFPSVKAGQAFSRGNSLVNKFVPSSISPGALTFAGENSAAQAANGIIDLISSHAMKDARDFDMANAQDDYVNTTSNQYGDCQILTQVLYTPDKDSEEFKQLAYQIYYFGYPREEIGMAGENNRIIYDYKKVSAIYSEITNNASVSAYMKIILLNGATFWHLENLASLTSDQKRQIITTANKYGIANYEPNLN